jgi:hypothetical protein
MRLYKQPLATTGIKIARRAASHSVEFDNIIVHKEWSISRGMQHNVQGNNETPKFSCGARAEEANERNHHTLWIGQST